MSQDWPLRIGGRSPGRSQGGPGFGTRGDWTQSVAVCYCGGKLAGLCPLLSCGNPLGSCLGGVGGPARDLKAHFIGDVLGGMIEHCV